MYRCRKRKLGACEHGLVAEGQVCPQCVWDLASRLPTWSSDQEKRKELLAICCQACCRAVAPELRGELKRIIDKQGPWYGLRFVRKSLIRR